MIRKSLIALSVAAAAALPLGLASTPAEASHYVLKCKTVPVKKVIWEYGYRKVIWVKRKECRKVYQKHYKKGYSAY